MAQRSGNVEQLGKALEIQQQSQPLQAVNDPTVGPYLRGPKGTPHFPPASRTGLTLGGLQAQVATELATDPATGVRDPNKVMEVLGRLRTNPSGAESRIFDYLARKNQTGITDPAMEQTIKDYQGAVLGTAQARGFGGATGRRQVEAQEKLKDIASTDQIIDDIALLSKRINTSKGGTGRFVQGATNLVGSVLQTNTDAADLQTLRDSYSLALSRSILSERGVLTNQDRSYATNAIPGLWDAAPLAERKIERMKRLNALQREAEEALAAGKPFNESDFRKRWRAAAGIGASATTQPTQQKPSGKLFYNPATGKIEER